MRKYSEILLNSSGWELVIIFAIDAIMAKLYALFCKLEDEIETHFLCSLYVEIRSCYLQNPFLFKCLSHVMLCNDTRAVRGFSMFLDHALKSRT